MRLVSFTITQNIFYTTIYNVIMTKISEIEAYILGKEVTSAQWASLMVLVKVTTEDGKVGWG